MVQRGAAQGGRVRRADSRSVANVPPPPELVATTCVIEGVEYVVLSHPLEGEDMGAEPLFAGLSHAQQAIARQLLAGQSYRDIAAQRGTSPRTVAKQVEGLYRRLGIGSRAELAALAVAPVDGAPTHIEDVDGGS